MNDKEILTNIIKEKDEIIKGKETQINFVRDLCKNKIEEYYRLLQLFKNEDVIVKNAKIEKDLAQQIYTILL
mgnify:CR=1 FL=1